MARDSHAPLGTCSPEAPRSCTTATACSRGQCAP